MSQISLSDFERWKSDPVTKAFFLACYERVEDAKELLSVRAGFDSLEDSMLRGLIQAYREMFDFRIDDLQEAVE